MGRRESKDRSSIPLNDLSTEYLKSAEILLTEKDGAVIRDEVSRFADMVVAGREGVEQDEHIERMLSAIVQRRPSALESVPDDKHERAAFAVALARTHKQTLQ